MAVLPNHRPIAAQEVTRQTPPPAIVIDFDRFPVATVVPPADAGMEVTLKADTQTERDGTFVLDGHVEIVYGDRVVQADHIEYDSKTGEMTATGHLLATGGTNRERIAASHGTLNMKQQTGRFYDVAGSVGTKSGGVREVYSTGNPFLFTGRIVVRTAPNEYLVYDGTVTSCQLAHPDWVLSAGRFSLDGQKATARNSVFHLLRIPILYLPYVTHPIDSERQGGLLIPVLGQSSSKGFIVGEEIYMPLGRSADLTVGATFYSQRGWAQAATFRYKGRDNDFATAHYSGLLDHGYTPTGGVYTNQGGEDVLFRGRHDFTAQTRAVADLEYLSSYTYREAFTDNFNQAVSSDIVSTVYGVHEADGMMASARADRYQGVKRAALAATATTPSSPEQQVRIFHAPSFDFDTTDHRLGRTGLLWSLESSSAGLKRVQPNFVTGGSIERLDLHPRLSLPVAGGGFHLLPSVGVRETLYSRNRTTPYLPGQAPVEGVGGLSRSDFEAEVDARLPVFERTFTGDLARKLFGGALRHTIEPEATYRYVTGVGNFLNVLRFDDKDVVSDTDELEYGVTQRLFAKPAAGKACSALPLPSTAVTEEETAVESNCGTSQRLAWRIAQKYFFDPAFGGAVLAGRRNILDTTLAFSGIAFLTEAREISPLISRLRMQTSEKTDLEWNFDYDTGAKKFTSNNIFVDVHQGKAFGGLSYARLNAPGRFYTEGVSSAVSNFNQLRVLLGYGSPTRAGLGVAANAGLDLSISTVQYAALQTSYNWNCCGLSVEYRKYELGAVRNENAYRFNFTLANIGTAGNLRRAERLF